MKTRFGTASHVLMMALLAAAIRTEAGAAGPVVFSSVDPARPDESVLLFGAGLAQTRAILLSRIPDDQAGNPTADLPGIPPAARSVPPLQPSETSVKFVIPEKEQPGIYAVQVDTPAGRSKVIVINRPEVWWVQGDAGLHATPGGWLRVFGKSLIGAEKNRARVLLRGAVVKSLEASGDCYQLRLSVPEPLPQGEYELSVHNGWGGPFGWSLPVKVVIQARRAWPDKVFSVLSFGADSTGVKDSTAAIQDALQAAGKNGGGIVYFPRGRYQVTQKLAVPRFTMLKGEKREWVSLFWPDMPQPPDALVKGSNSFGLEDLTLYCSNYQHVIVGDFGDQPEAGDVVVRRVRVRADLYRGHPDPKEVHERFTKFQKLSSGGGDTLRVGGSKIEVTDCDLYGSGRSLALGYARGATISGNTLANGRWGWYDIYNSENVIFEKNDVVGADLMSTGGGLSCWRTKMPRQQNIYVGQNAFRLMHGWDREAMTSDGGGGAYQGPVASATADTIAIPAGEKWHAPDLAGMTCFVVRGKGAAQWRLVREADPNRVRLDRPWDVIPDASSTVSIVMTHRNYLVIGNDFSDCGIAVQFYGTALGHIVAQNRCTRGGGFQGFGKQYGDYRMPPEKSPAHQPNWFVQFLDNEILEGTIYRGGANNAVLSGSSVIGVLGHPPKADWPWPYNLGAVVRRNTLHHEATIQVGGGGGPGHAVVDCVVEHNRISRCATGIQIDGNADGVLLRKNRFTEVLKPLAGDGAPRAGGDPKAP